MTESNYHVKRKDKELTDQADMKMILKNGRYVTLSLCRDNEPYIVTMNYGYDEALNALFFHCALEGDKLDFIADNPDTCGTVIEDLGYGHGNCEHFFRSIVLRGKIYTVDTLEEKKQGISVLIDHLEEHLDEAKARFLKDDKTYNKIHILRLNIENITGKQGLKKK